MDHHLKTRCRLLTASTAVTMVTGILFFVFATCSEWYQFEMFLHMWKKIIAKKNINPDTFQGIIPTLQDYLEGGIVSNPVIDSVLFVPIYIFAVVTMAISVYGAYSSHRRRANHLIAFSVMTYLSIVFIFLFVWQLTDLTSLIHVARKKSLHSRLQNNYDVDPASKKFCSVLANSAMIAFECCGLHGPADMLDLPQTFTFRNVTLEPRFPPACCKQERIREGFPGISKCLRERKLDDINRDGCYDNMYLYVKQEYGYVIALVLAVVIFIECVQIVLAASITFDTWEVEKDQTKKALIKNTFLAVALMGELKSKQPHNDVRKRRFSKLSTEHKSDLGSDTDDPDRKERTIKILGLEESSVDSDRVRDVEDVQKLIKVIDSTLDTSYLNSSNVRRVEHDRRLSGVFRPRPVRILLASVKDKLHILNNVRKLKHHPRFGSVRIKEVWRKGSTYIG